MNSTRLSTNAQDIRERMAHDTVLAFDRAEARLLRRRAADLRSQPGSGNMLENEPSRDVRARLALLTCRVLEGMMASIGEDRVRVRERLMANDDDEGLMLTWFANALMRGYNQGFSRAKAACDKEGR